MGSTHVNISISVNQLARKHSHLHVVRSSLFFCFLLTLEDCNSCPERLGTGRAQNFSSFKNAMVPLAFRSLLGVLETVNLVHEGIL